MLATPPATQLNPIPLFHAAWLFAGGITLAHFFWLRPSLVLVALSLVAALSILAAFRAQRIAWLPLAILWLLLGAWCSEVQPRPALAQPLASLSDGLLRTVEGTVIDASPLRSEIVQNLNNPAPTEQPSQHIDLRLSTLEQVTDAADRQSPISGTVRMTIRLPLPDPSGPLPLPPFHCGDRIRALARLREPETYHDAGVWSREDFLVDQGVTALATLDVDQVVPLGPSAPSWPCRISVWQHAAASRLLALPLAMRRLPASLRISSDDAVMLSAMVAGDRTYLTHSLRVGFERTGSFHMLVVSGFHMAIVAGCIFWLARRMRLPRVPATLVTIAASFAYALFTGFATPVQRSLWMVTLYLLGRLVYRDRSPLNTIGFAALCLLAVSPRSLFDASLQMTLLAVAAIAGIATPILQNSIHPYLLASRELNLTAIDVKLPAKQAQFRETMRIFVAVFESTPLHRLARGFIPAAVGLFLRLVELIVVSCVIELAMTLPMAIYFHRITLFALPVNLFILPLLAVLMPLALLTLATALLAPSAAVVPAALTAIPLHFGIWLVHLFGSIVLADMRTAMPIWQQSTAFCVLFVAAIALARRAHTRFCWTALALAAASAVAPRPIQHPQSALFLEAIDVGQGDSLLVITPDGKTLLVDGGGFGGGPAQAPQDFDIGEEVVSPALWARGISHLDAVALTHAHSDHMGGLPAVLRNFHPDELWVGNNPRFGAYNDLLNEAATLHVRFRSFRAGDALAFGEAQIAVLAPFPDYEPGPEPKNNDSLVLHINYGVTSILLEGDAEGPLEDAMLNERGLASTLLKVGHHGSVTSTRPEFLARVAPQWAVISCGLHNRYGHPRPEVLQALQGANVRTFSTDITGAACFRLDGKFVTPDPACGSQTAF